MHLVLVIFKLWSTSAVGLCRWC